MCLIFAWNCSSKSRTRDKIVGNYLKGEDSPAMFAFISLKCPLRIANLHFIFEIKEMEIIIYHQAHFHHIQSCIVRKFWSTMDLICKHYFKILTVWWHSNHYSAYYNKAVTICFPSPWVSGRRVSLYNHYTIYPHLAPHFNLISWFFSLWTPNL